MAGGLFILVVLALGLALFLWWLVVLIDALRTPSSTWEQAGQNQLIYVLLMALLGVVGTIIYVVVARPKLRAAALPT